MERFQRKTERRSLRSRKVCSRNKRNGRWQKEETNNLGLKSAAGSVQNFKFDLVII